MGFGGDEIVLMRQVETNHIQSYTSLHYQQTKSNQHKSERQIMKWPQYFEHGSQDWGLVAFVVIILTVACM